MYERYKGARVNPLSVSHPRQQIDTAPHLSVRKVYALLSLDTDSKPSILFVRLIFALLTSLLYFARSRSRFCTRSAKLFDVDGELRVFVMLAAQHPDP